MHPHYQAFERNLELYRWYSNFTGAFFWMPVFFLYFSSILPIDQVLLLESVYYFAVVLAEVPTGYAADSIGRKFSLVAGAICQVVAYSLFAFGSSFVLFAAGQAFFGLGLSLKSGANTALHFESLKELGREEEFGAREARVSKEVHIAGGLAGLVGGLVSLIDLKLAYICSLLAACAALAVSLFVHEPLHIRRSISPFGFLMQLRSCVSYLLRDQVLRWYAAVFVMMICLNHLPYMFYQSYLDLLLGGQTKTPLISGIHIITSELCGF
jgi:MFS family permease